VEARGEIGTAPVEAKGVDMVKKIEPASEPEEQGQAWPRTTPCPDKAKQNY
jgi:hypothetical protein